MDSRAGVGKMPVARRVRGGDEAPRSQALFIAKEKWHACLPRGKLCGYARRMNGKLSVGIAIGIAIGIGAAIGATIGNIAMGIGIGVALGIALAPLLKGKGNGK